MAIYPSIFAKKTLCGVRKNQTGLKTTQQYSDLELEGTGGVTRSNPLILQRLNNLPKVTQLLSIRTDIRTRIL